MVESKDIKHMVCVERIKHLEEENKKLNEMCGKLWEMNGKLWEWVNNLEKENKNLKEENKKLKSDLEECECSMHFENDEVWYRKRECKRLKEDVDYFRQCYLDLKKLCEKEWFMLSNEEVTKILDKIK